jgi:heavy metal efflux system protein
MLNRLVEFALTQRTFVLICALIVTASGVYAFLHISIDAFPNIAPVQAKIILKAPGMTPEEVETRVITPMPIPLVPAQSRGSASPARSWR